MKEILFLQPVFKEVLWGGSRLRDCFGYEIPSDHTGECWAISGHSKGDCTIKNGKFAGKTLGWLWKNEKELFDHFPGEEFPLLTKIIDAREDLSIQVHPDDAYANEHENGALGKTECWYVLDALEGTEIVIGHHAKTKEELCDMIEEGRWNELIQVYPLKKGDFYQIDPGTVHAIKGGSLILEIQQSSDVTYRLYDYDRLQNGVKRPLHLKESKDVIRCPHKETVSERKTEKEEGWEKEHLVTCPFYTVEKIIVDGSYKGNQDAPFLMISVIEGEGKLNETPVKKGDHMILPAEYGTYCIEGPLSFVTAKPER